jgi:hypothetical protein
MDYYRYEQIANNRPITSALQIIWLKALKGNGRLSRPRNSYPLRKRSRVSLKTMVILAFKIIQCPRVMAGFKLTE